MKNLSVKFKLRLLLGIAIASLGMVVIALFLLTSQLTRSLGGLVDLSIENAHATFSVVEASSEAQAKLFKLVKEKDPDSIEALVGQTEVFAKLVDSLTNSLKDDGVIKTANSLHNKANATVEKILMGEYAIAQQMLVEEYNPEYSNLFSEIDRYNRLKDAEFEKQKTEENSQIQSRRTLALLLSLFAIVLLIGLGFVILQAIGSALTGMIDTLKDLVQGEADLTKRLQADSEDELGQMAKLFNQFLEQQATLIRSVSDTTAQVVHESTPLNENTRKINEVARNVSNKAQGVASAVEQSSTALTGITQHANQMGGMISTVAAAMEEMASSLRDTQTRCQEEVHATEKGTKLANDTQKTIQRLDDSALEVGKVVDVIRDIAEQTNLLALNATIEAATAGEAGKGFAVVAGEVKELAKQTAAATETIAQQAQAMRSATSDTIHALESIAQTISEIAQSSLAIQASVEEQSRTVKDVARSGAEASHAAQNIVRNVQESSTGLKEIASSASGLDQDSATTLRGIQAVGESSVQLSKAAEKLQAMVGRFKL